jgi:NAD-dependent deacetylase
MDEVEELKKLIKKAKKIVFFGGAGVSTESGIPDFRSENGLYKLKSEYDAPYEVMLSHTYFEEHTATFYEFYKEFMVDRDAKPNPAHIFLAKLEKKKDLTIVTQNIDGLHQMAGSKNVIELHGSIHRNYCVDCGKAFSLDYVMSAEGIPHCDRCGGIVKPDVVLYEEPLNEANITKALIAIQSANLLIVAGTSLNVYPAAGLINYFYGDNIVVINKEDILTNRDVKLKIKSPIGEVFSKISDIL